MSVYGKLSVIFLAKIRIRRGKQLPNHEPKKKHPSQWMKKGTSTINGGRIV